MSFALTFCRTVLLFFGVFMSASLAAVTLHFAGSSILDDAGRRPEHYPYASWGTELERHMFATNRVRNLARSGASTKSFRASGRWKELIDGVKPGDFVGMQFGGNDQKRSNEFYLKERYAPPWGLYTEILREWIGEVRAKGATPILISHFPRCTFDAGGKKLVEGGNPGEKLSDYREAMRVLACETGCDFVDMNTLVHDRVESLGKEAALMNYVISTGFRKGKDGEPSKDTTHPCQRGAEMYAQLFIDEVRRRNLPVARLFSLD